MTYNIKILIYIFVMVLHMTLLIMSFGCINVAADKDHKMENMMQM